MNVHEIFLPQKDNPQPKPVVVRRTFEETSILKFLVGPEKVDKADDVANTAYSSTLKNLTNTGLDKKTIDRIANRIAEDVHRAYLWPEENNPIKTSVVEYKHQREKRLEKVYNFALRALQDNNKELALKIKDKLYEEEDYYHAGLLAISLGSKQEAIGAVEKLIDPNRYHGKKLMKDAENAAEIILKLDDSAKTTQDHFENDELKEKCVNVLINANTCRNAALIAIKLGLNDKAREIIKSLISSEKTAGAGQAAIKLGDKKLIADIINILIEKGQTRSALLLIKNQEDFLSLELLIQHLKSKADIKPEEQKVLKSACLLLERLINKRNLNATLEESADR